MYIKGGFNMITRKLKKTNDYSYRVVIPAVFVKKLNLSDGDKIEFYFRDNKVFFEKKES
jgi:bifunctional DNA-binding transcriptional regulator/antitoxin component of YhaV-PrlF toxin-antitoxin module